MKITCKSFSLCRFWYLQGVLELIIPEATEGQLHSEKDIEISDDVCGFEYFSCKFVFTSCILKSVTRGVNI